MKSIPLLAFLAAVSLLGCQHSVANSDNTQANQTSGDGQHLPSDTKGVSVMVVKTQTIPEYEDLPAHIESDPVHVVHVFTPAGGRILEVRVRPWDRVEKGEEIASLESSDLARAVADYQKARSDNDLKQKALVRSKDLFDHKAIAEKDYQQAQSDAEQGEAEVRAAREQVAVFGLDPDHAGSHLSVTAPRSGIVLDVGAAPGEFSKSLDAPVPLCTIADISTVWAVGDLYEQDIRTIRSNEEAQVALNAYPDQHWTGHISVVSAAVDPATHTLQVRVILQNSDGKIKPAMFGSIRILRSASQGILVPATAVIREGNDSYVYVRDAQGRFQKRNVSLGRAIDSSLQVTSGLTPGETIVSEGGLLLRSDAQG